VPYRLATDYKICDLEWPRMAILR